MPSRSHSLARGPSFGSRHVRLSSNLVVNGKGQVDVDNGEYEPERSPLTGGFGGGEKGLKKFVQEKGIPYGPDVNYVKEEYRQVADPAKPIGKGKDLIYVGKPKGAKEVDDKTKFVKDDARLYPDRNALTGGFAGGEVGLKRFSETGDIGLKEDGVPGKPQPQSPLVLAFGLGGVAAIGAIVSDPENFPTLSKLAAEKISSGDLNLVQAGSDLAQSPAAVYVVGAVAFLVLGGYTLTQMKKATEGLVESVQKFAVTGVFGLVVLKLALTILAD